MAVYGDEETVYAGPPSFNTDSFSRATVRSPRHHLTTFHLTLVPFAHLCLYLKVQASLSVHYRHCGGALHAVLCEHRREGSTVKSNGLR